jgi:G3E family GTPase
MTASVITPVFILTGFLGSGKTTLLNKLLGHARMRDTAVLINEFGAVSIDHLLVRESSENMAVLSNGCICCSVAGDMVTALRDLYFKRANGEAPHFTRVVIETTGLADPAPIMHTLIDMPLVAARYSLGGIITTIDAEHAEAQWSQHMESVKQAAVADRIVITKTECVSPSQRDALKQRLADLNPGANVFEASHGEIDPAVLFDTGLYQPGNKTPDVRKWLAAEKFRVHEPRSTSLPPLASPTRVAGPRAERHDARIQAFAICYDEPLPWMAFVDALETLIDLYSDRLLRVKGIIHVAGEPTPRVVHAVQHTIYPAARLPQWPDADHRTRLVIITRDLDSEAVHKTLSSFLGGAQPESVSGKTDATALPATTLGVA